MTTTTELRLPTPVELYAVENAMSTVYNELERLTRLVVRSSKEDGSPAVPTYENIGHLYLFAEHMKTDAEQVTDRANEILGALMDLDSIRAETEANGAS
jgi:elongation factor P--beta-lysine ligase